MPTAAVAGQLALGDHVCWRFDDDDQLLDAMAGFVASGVNANHKVVYFTEALLPPALTAGLAARGVPLHAGQVDVWPARQRYLTGGRFDPDAMLRTLEDLVARARAEGYLGLRLVGDMGWAVAHPPGVEHLPRYETRINRVFLDGQALAVCLYDRRTFDEATLRQVSRAHPASTPSTVAGSEWVPLLRIHRTAHPYGLRLVGEADLTNRHGLAGALDALLEAVPDTTVPPVIDLTGLRFADGATAGLLLRTAELAPAGLHLIGCQPAVAVLLRCLDAANVPGILVTTVREQGGAV